MEKGYICLYVHMSISTFRHLNVCLYICMSVSTFVYHYICTPVGSFVHLSVHYMSISTILSDIVSIYPYQIALKIHLTSCLGIPFVIGFITGGTFCLCMYIQEN